VTICSLALLACGGGPGPGDGGLGPDGAIFDAAVLADGSAAGADGGSARDGGGCRGGETRVLEDVGYCFEATTCCAAADCGSDRAWICNADGLCEEDRRACGCVDDLDCPESGLCITNAVVCGVCVVPGDLCVEDRNCDAGQRCDRGYCIDDADCQGYPPP